MKIADIIQKIDNNLIPFFQYCYNGRNKQYKNIIYNFFINRQIKQIRPILKIIYVYIFSKSANLQTQWHQKGPKKNWR